MRRITIAFALLATAACGQSVSAPAPAIPAPTAGMVSETFTGTVGSGDPHCIVGLAPFTLDEGPCQVFGPISTSSGRIDAMLTYGIHDPALRFQLYEPA